MKTPDTKATLDGRPSCGCRCGALAGYCFAPVVPPPITDTVAPLGPNATAMVMRCRKPLTTVDALCQRHVGHAGYCSFGDKQPSPRPTAGSEHEALVAKIVAVGVFTPMAKRIAAMLIREYKMVPNETEVPDER